MFKILSIFLLMALIIWFIGYPIYIKIKNKSIHKELDSNNEFIYTIVFSCIEFLICIISLINLFI